MPRHTSICEIEQPPLTRGCLNGSRDSDGRSTSAPETALLALVRLLARQAAAEWCAASAVTTDSNNNLLDEIPPHV